MQPRRVPGSAACESAARATPRRLQEFVSTSAGGEPVKAAVSAFLAQSGQALQIQNLAFALRERLVLPYEAAAERPEEAPEGVRVLRVGC